MKKRDIEWMQRHANHGAQLADLAAKYFAVFPPEHRERQIKIWVETMRELIPINEREATRQ